MKNYPQVETFIKVFGSDGVAIYPEGTNVEEVYPGLIRRTKLIEGIGVPLTDKLWKVFRTHEAARRFEGDTRGPLTSGNLIIEPFGTRERW